MIENAAGVLGGVGPLATAYFLRRVVDLTVASTDQEHLNMVVLNHATIPDRTAFLTGRSADNPLPVLIADARTLADLGVRVIAMPCNTAAYFHAELAAAVPVPVLDIVGGAVAAAQQRVPGLRRLGVLATDGTIHAGTYARACAERDIEYLVPPPDVQAEVMAVIYDGVKAGVPVPRERYEALLGAMRGQGAQAIVLGCTELSILGSDYGLAPDVVDSLDVLAANTIVACGKQLRTDD